jgi:mitogen-activated protein kinase kinase
MQPPGADSSEGHEISVAPDAADWSEEIFDAEVAAWIKERLDARMDGDSAKDRPALHTVALDAVPGSPLLEDPSILSAHK